ncbi:AraC family transcriptional regulator [Halalkalibacter urbisdiaboli]|uniref:AraC family transcriptional regulator n=1 Tax=Halalkalibacter urbisdiaboli TaxID=1960589 RepID=UPI000B438E59|nr:AraC family transcriptional regulator [Halalkalibacter urbisdiaboli]
MSVEGLLSELLELTEEEQEILRSNKTITKDTYTSQSDFIIESEKFLNPDTMIMVRKHTRFIAFPKHKHNYIELNYVFNGGLHQTVGGEKLHLKKGELLFLNQHIEHEIEACEEDDIVINFIIQPKFFEFVFSFLNTENRVSNFLVNSLYNHTHDGQFLYFKISEVESIQELIHKIIEEIMHSSFMSESTIKLYMGLLVVELIKHSDKVEQTKTQSLKHMLVIESLKYIHSNYQEASLYELAKNVNQPHYLLSKIIKSATNHTFKELLQERRLLKAKELLESSEVAISAIVEQVGYDNISYFYRIFKEKYGQTPKKYRENWKQL